MTDNTSEQPVGLSDEHLERKLQKIIYDQYLVGNGSDLTTQAVLGFIRPYLRQPVRESGSHLVEKAVQAIRDADNGENNIHDIARAVLTAVGVNYEP